MKAEKLQLIEKLPFVLKTELSDELAFAQPKPQNETHYWTISLVVHVLLLALAIYFMPTNNQVNIPQAPLQTYLVKAKPNTIKPIDEQAKSTKVSSEEELIQVVETKTENPETNKQLENDLQKPLNSDSQKPVVITNDDTSNITNTRDTQKYSIRKSITKALLQQYVNDEAKNLSQQSAKAFQDAQTSPTINTTTSIDTWEISDEIAPTLIDCQNTAKKSLAIIATYTGGNIGCLDNSNFQQFIDKHKNKGVIAKPETNNK